MNLYTNVPNVPEHATSVERACVVMFSGGRDSTLAALRLSKKQCRLLLVTATSDHLAGIHLVKRRLDEFRLKTAMRATWIRVVQPPQLTPTAQMEHPTCLPCHAAYSALAVRFALDHHVSNIAFGYTAYQSNWVEQTPQAIAILRRHLQLHGLKLVLPASDLSSKADAVQELRSLGLTETALEQKCLVQQLNHTLPPAELADELERWDRSLSQAFCLAKRTNLHVIDRATLGPTEMRHA